MILQAIGNHEPVAVLFRRLIMKKRLILKRMCFKPCWIFMISLAYFYTLYKLNLTNSFDLLNMLIISTFVALQSELYLLKLKVKFVFFLLLYSVLFFGTMYFMIMWLTSRSINISEFLTLELTIYFIFLIVPKRK